MQKTTFVQNLNETLAAKSLLNHPFYQAWNDGSVTMDTLRVYAGQYYHHVNAFPRYLSALHSQCETTEARQLILENLIDEERGEENHPELWMRFVDALGLPREKAREMELFPETKAIIENFMASARSSYAEGLGALYAYEHQIPAIAAFKQDALRKFYGMNDTRSTSFFEVHKQADVYHTEAVASLMERLPADEKAKAEAAAVRCGELLWKFLDAVDAKKAS